MFDLKIGFKCNNNCVHCVVADKRTAGDLPIDELFSIIDKVPENIGIQITGGEPSIYRTLPQILQKCKENGHYVVMQTNGTGFADSDFFNQCRDYIDHIHIAIHSCLPHIHDQIVQSEGMWNKTMQGLDNILTANNIKVTTQTVLSRLNMPSLFDTFSFIQNKIPGVQMSMTYPHVMGNAYKNRKEIIFRYSEYKDIIQKTLASFKEHIYTEAIPPCYLYPNFPSCSLEQGLLNRDTLRIGVDFSENKENKDYNFLDIKSKRKAPRCKQCLFNNKCVGVWKEYIDQFKDCLDLYPITE